MPDIRIPSKDGEFGAYVALPPGGTGPGIVVIQEIFGVNAVMRGWCDFFASKGYIAMCPDLFWRQEPGIQITDQSQAEWDKAFALYKGFHEAKGVDDLFVTLAYLREYPGCTGKAGAVGFCLGGKLAYLMATRTSCDVSVGYYGVGIENDLAEASAITKPLILHIAEKDGFVPPEAQAKVKVGLGQYPLVTLYSYPNVDHAFARKGGAHFDAAAASLAEQRTLEAFKKYLG
jgi:carboxymethylenebutenolidase